MATTLAFTGSDVAGLAGVPAMAALSAGVGDAPAGDATAGSLGVTGGATLATVTPGSAVDEAAGLASGVEALRAAHKPPAAANRAATPPMASRQPRRLGAATKPDWPHEFTVGSMGCIAPVGVTCSGVIGTD